MQERDIASRIQAPGRLARLAVRRIMDTPRDAAFDRLTRLAAKAMHVPVTLITLVDGHRQWFKSSFGLRQPWEAQRETPLSHSFCQYVVAYEDTLVVPDARADPLVRENLAIPELGVAAYLGVPLRDVDGSVLGSFAAIDGEVRFWSEEEIDLLKDFSDLAMTQIILQAERERRRETEAMLYQAQKMDALGRFASGIAHDFVSLLSVIKGSAWLLGEELEANEPLGTGIEDIKRAVDSATQLVSQLLEFGGEKEIRKERIQLDALLRRFEPMLRRLLPRSIELVLDLPDEPLFIEADAAQIEVALVNLSTNARDAMPEGGRLSLRVERIVAGAEEPAIHDRVFARISVSDTGVGMDEDTKARLFEPFFTTKGPGEGSGLGLAMVFRTVQQLGGSISVESVLGAGTSLRLDVPAATSQQPPLPDVIDSPRGRSDAR